MLNDIAVSDIEERFLDTDALNLFSRPAELSIILLGGGNK